MVPSQYLSKLLTVGGFLKVSIIANTTLFMRAEIRLLNKDRINGRLGRIRNDRRLSHSVGVGQVEHAIVSVANVIRSHLEQNYDGMGTDCLGDDQSQLSLSDKLSDMGVVRFRAICNSRHSIRQTLSG